jgi:hypothetical protein
MCHVCWQNDSQQLTHNMYMPHCAGDVAYDPLSDPQVSQPYLNLTLTCIICSSKGTLMGNLTCLASATAVMMQELHCSKWI